MKSEDDQGKQHVQLHYEGNLDCIDRSNTYVMSFLQAMDMKIVERGESTFNAEQLMMFYIHLRNAFINGKNEPISVDNGPLCKPLRLAW